MPLSHPCCSFAQFSAMITKYSQSIQSISYVCTSDINGPTWWVTWTKYPDRSWHHSNFSRKTSHNRTRSAVPVNFVSTYQILYCPRWVIALSSVDIFNERRKCSSMKFTTDRRVKISSTCCSQSPMLLFRGLTWWFRVLVRGG